MIKHRNLITQYISNSLTSAKNSSLKYRDKSYN